MVQGNLFKDDVQLAIELLESKGYVIILPNKKININCDKLVRFFYSRLSFYRVRGSYFSSNIGRDRMLAKKFAQSLFDRGCPEKNVWDYAHKVIETMLKYEDKLSLRNPITDMSVLGQDKMKWITDTAIYLLEEEEDVGIRNLEEKLEYLQDSFVEESIEKDPNDLYRILRSIKNGEKETNS